MKRFILFFLTVFAFPLLMSAQCDFTFNPSGNVYDPGDDVSITICFQDYTNGFPEYEKADYSDDNTNWDIDVSGDDGNGITYTALGSGNDQNSTYCVKVEFVAGSQGNKITIRAQATGLINGCDADQTQSYVLIPIVLESFKVKLDNNTAILDWVTLSEANNDFFTIEMSTNGIDFTSLGDIKGAGNSRDRLEYRLEYLLDENVKHLPFVYFRLKQTDFDGVSTYSDVIILSNDKSKKAYFALNKLYFDNSNIRFNITSSDDSEMIVNLSDLSGHSFFKKNIDTHSGLSEIVIPADNLESGIYIIQVISNNKMITKKLFIK